MRDLLAMARAIGDRPSIASVTLSPGFAYADVPRLGFGVLAYGWDGADADAAVDQLAEAVWRRRDDFAVVNLPPAAAVAHAVAATRHPVVLVEVADNIGGGAPGDGVAVLAELLAQGATGAVITVADPQAVAAAAAAGAGSTVELAVGPRRGAYGRAIVVRGVVRSVLDGAFVHEGDYMTGQRTSMGVTAVVECDGVELVLTERPTMPFDANQLRCVGIEPSERRIIVVKAAIAWKAAFGAMAAESIAVETPGVCATDLTSLAYQHAPRPIYPLDPVDALVAAER
jgi:microcystin degradation protein MlrC